MQIPFQVHHNTTANIHVIQFATSTCSSARGRMRLGTPNPPKPGPQRAHTTSVFERLAIALQLMCAAQIHTVVYGFVPKNSSKTHFTIEMKNMQIIPQTRHVYARAIRATTPLLAALPPPPPGAASVFAPNV